jgi:dihydrofolate reductase
MGQSTVSHFLCGIFCLILCSAVLLFQSACAPELPQIVLPATPSSTAIVKTMSDKAPPPTKTPAPVDSLESIEKVRTEAAVPKDDRVIAKDKKTSSPDIGPLRRFVITGVPAVSISGAAWDSPAHDIRVTAYDSSGIVKTDYVGSVYFTSTDRAARLPFAAASKYRFTPEDKGTHTFTSDGFVMSSAGTQTIAVTDGRIKSAAGPVKVFHQGSDWVKVTGQGNFPHRAKHGCVTFKNKLWIVGGETSSPQNDVWFSSDGVSWSCATKSAAFSPRTDHLTLVFDNRMWVIGGKDGSHFMGTNDVWYTTNGVDWIRTTENAGFPKRFSHSGVVFNNRMWVIGGKYQNDIWWSNNGSDWTRASKDVPFGSRYGHTSLVYKNRIWVIGGYRAGYQNDVWWSANGSDWTQSIAHANFSPRAYHTGFVYGGKMWVIGGYENTPKGDVWFSSDGVSWSCATKSAAFGVRNRHACTVFNSRMWLLGGSYPGDVWRTGSTLN